MTPRYKRHSGYRGYEGTNAFGPGVDGFDDGTVNAGRRIRVKLGGDAYGCSERAHWNHGKEGSTRMFSSLHALRLAPDIAEQVAGAWRAAHIDGRLAIPLSAVAVLAMNEGNASDRRQMRAVVLSWDDDQFAAYARAQWGTLALVRPELVVPALPLIDVWAGERSLSPQQLRSAKRAADAALRAGLTELTGTERRFEADVLGMLLTALRSRADHQARGQFYTPPQVSDLIARLLARNPASLSANRSFHDATAGSGGLLRAVANELRWAGINPASVQWSATDPDELAIACLAVNVVLWGLGSDVLLVVTDCLTNPLLDTARQERQEMRELMARMRIAHEGVELLTRLEALLRGTNRRETINE